MAQEDKGLVLRGLGLLTLIGVLVVVVLGILFWRTPVEQAKSDPPLEPGIALIAIPNVGGYPAGIAWPALVKLGENCPSAPGWDIRYNAAASFARRGSANVPWPLLREMLDEPQQMRNNRVRLPDGRDVYDEAAARATMVTALRAVSTWHEKQTDKTQAVPSDLRDIYAQVDKLTESPFVELKVQAEKARATFFR